MIPARAEARLRGRARPITAVLVTAAALIGLHWVTASGESTGLRFTGTVEDPARGDRSSGRVWFPSVGAVRPNRDPKTIRSLLDIRQSMAFGDFVWNDTGIPAGPMWVRVDLRRQVISLFRGGNEIATAVIIYGAQNKPTPLGSFKVLEKDKDYRSATYDAAMPYALFLTHDGVAIHASDVQYRNATHGCIGVPIAFAQRLFAALEVGDPVDIIQPT